ncbi:hypothetical protein JHK82_024854 [Glycine max]|nr:hypothetical protein JHK82_024854 [Glycine max]
MLAKENDELKMKLKALIEDNSKLIELYEQAAAENNNRNVNKGEDGQEIGSKIDNELKNFDMLTFTLARSRHHSKGHEIGYVVVVRTMARVFVLGGRKGNVTVGTTESSLG